VRKCMPMSSMFKPVHAWYGQYEWTSGSCRSFQMARSQCICLGVFAVYLVVLLHVYLYWLSSI
jgi:hypothetical protein